MFRLTRQVRFAINATPDDQLSGRPTNGFAGFPSLTGLGHYFALDVTLSGELDSSSQYLRNIKEIDQVVREHAVPAIATRVSERTFGRGGRVVLEVFDLLRARWPGTSLESLKLSLSPFLALSVFSHEHPMVRLSQKFEFSASHRLHSENLSADENARTFGKCNNPHGHGHNYEVQVTLAGRPDENGVVIDVPAFERIVASTVIERFDHKNLNLQVPEFRELIPTVENIALTIYKLLKPRFDRESAKLASVTVWETPKTWCEYGEEMLNAER